MLCSSTPYSRLARITKTIGKLRRAAVHRAWIEYIAEPLPEMHSSGRSRCASTTLVAPARPYLMPPLK